MQPSPLFSRIDEYSGAWAMEPNAFRARLEALQRLDLAAHMAANPPPKLKSGAEKIPVRGGSSVAVVKILGSLMKQQSSMESGTSTVQLRRDIRNAAADPDVSAILLAVDSPGGTVAGTDDLASEVKAARKKKPVWAFIDDLGASAAYWVASQAEKIFANSPTALVGSIGTIAVVYDVSAMAEKDGIKANVFSTGPLKGSGVPGTALTPEQSDYYQGIVDQIQKSFDEGVQKGRNLTDKQLTDVRSGAVFTASEALTKKLIDGIQSYDATLEQLATAARKQARETKMETIEIAGEAVQPAAVSARNAPTVAPPIAPAVDHDSHVSAIAKATGLEIERQSHIRQLCANHPGLTVDVNGQPVNLEAHAITERWSRDQTELAVLRASRPSGTIISRSHDRDCTLETLQGAMLLRFGGQLDHPAYRSQQAVAMKVSPWLRAGLNDSNRNRIMELSHRFADMSAYDICRESFRIGGRDIPSGSRHDVIRAAFSGSSLTNIFTDSVNARLLATYMEAGDSTMGWTQETEVADFKTNTDIALTKGPGLAKLPRGGEADHERRSDEAETYKIARYAKQFVVDEQDMIDDALNAFVDMPVEMGNEAARLRPDLIYALILDNPSLTATGRDLFNSTDDNIDTGSALTSATLKVGISNMNVKQQNSVNLNLNPTHLIVPSTLRFLGRELISASQIIFSGTSNTAVERGNMNTIQQEGLQLVADARLENGVTDPNTGTAQSGSASTWYLACARARTILVAFLRGTGRAPQTRSFVLTQGQWGMGWDINMDIGVKARDWRGMYKATA